MTVKELCDRYLEDMRAGLILGKGGRPKKPSTVGTDIGRINGHIVPLLGQRRVRDLSKADVTEAMNDIIAGKTRAVKKSAKLRGKSILRGGAGAASRCVGVIGSMLNLCHQRRRCRAQRRARHSQAQRPGAGPAVERR